MKYTTSTIQKACRMLREGAKIKDILKETGIKTHTVIYWHCDPERRAKQIDRGRKWMKRNSEKWKKISERAMKKYREKHGK